MVAASTHEQVSSAIPAAPSRCRSARRTAYTFRFPAFRSQAGAEPNELLVFRGKIPSSSATLRPNECSCHPVTCALVAARPVRSAHPFFLPGCALAARLVAKIGTHSAGVGRPQHSLLTVWVPPNPVSSLLTLTSTHREYIIEEKICDLTFVKFPNPSTRMRGVFFGRVYSMRHHRCRRRGRSLHVCATRIEPKQIGRQS